MKLPKIHLACCLSFLFFSSWAEGHPSLYDMNSVNYPEALCNNEEFSVDIKRSPNFQAFQQDLLKDALFPSWARKRMYWSCDSSTIVYMHLGWWIVSGWIDVQPYPPTTRSEQLVVLYSPDFKRWAAMVEVREDIPGRGWQLTRRDWLNEPPPGYRGILISQTVDPVLYEEELSHKYIIQPGNPISSGAER
jgi:hypothetical protein